MGRQGSKLIGQMPTGLFCQKIIIDKDGAYTVYTAHFCLPSGSETNNALPFRVPPDISVPRAGAGWIGTFGASIVTVDGSFVGEWRKTGRVAPPTSNPQEHKRQPTVLNNCTYAESPGRH
jgi:hypothetical protein